MECRKHISNQDLRKTTSIHGLQLEKNQNEIPCGYTAATYPEKKYIFGWNPQISALRLNIVKRWRLILFSITLTQENNGLICKRTGDFKFG